MGLWKLTKKEQAIIDPITELKQAYAKKVVKYINTFPSKEQRRYLAMNASSCHFIVCVEVDRQTTE